jgi:hypothetical protein
MENVKGKMEKNACTQLSMHNDQLSGEFADDLKSRAYRDVPDPSSD